MPYGYLGEQPIQSKSNSGVFNTVDALDLQSDGEWGGSLEHIETLTPNGVNNITCSVLPTNYNIIKIVYTVNVDSPASNVFRLNFFESGVEETGNVYHYAQLSLQKTGSLAQSNTTSSDDLYLGNFNGNGSNGHAYFYNLSDNTKYSTYAYHVTDLDGTVYFGSGGLLQKSTVDQIKFRNANAPKIFTSGSEIKIYGIKELWVIYDY